MNILQIIALVVFKGQPLLENIALTAKAGIASPDARHSRNFMPLLDQSMEHTSCSDKCLALGGFVMCGR